MNLNWNALVQPRQTVVVYMGLLGVNALCQQLMEHGMKRSMPIALVQQATTPSQRVLMATLETMPKKLEGADIKPPTLIIIGEVVKLHEKLAWFEPIHAH